MDTNRLQPYLEDSFSRLPPHATQASRLRYAIARKLSDAAPSSFGQECVLTGSSSRGIADEYSDIEMMFYTDTLPPYAEREQWLQTVGARDIVLDHEKTDEQEVWATFYPERLVERINAIFTLQQSEQTVACYLKLIRDTLELVPASYNVTRALSNVQESLHMHGFEV